MSAEIGAYLMVAVFVGFLSRLMVIDDAESIPSDAKLAVATLCGVLWPLTICAAIGLVLLFGTCAIAASFAALWRTVRPPRPRVPRATAQERSP